MSYVYLSTSSNSKITYVLRITFHATYPILDWAWLVTWISTTLLVALAMASKREASVSGPIRFVSRLSDLSELFFSKARQRTATEKSLTSQLAADSRTRL